MAELGFDLSPLGRNTPLHDAAWAGDLETVKLLVELGADTSIRDPHYGGTPLGWAAHNRQRAMVEYLLPLADVFDAVQNGGLARATELLREDPARARTVDPEGNPLVFHVRTEREHAAELLALLVTHGADLDAHNA